MIDSILYFSSLQAAKDDPVLQAHRAQLQDWQGSYVIPNLRSWRVSQDTTSTDPDGNPIVTHSYRSGWGIMISLPQQNSSLFNHASLIVMIDRDKANARRSGMILKANVSNPIMQDTRWEPVFMGADYPWGAWT